MVGMVISSDPGGMVMDGGPTPIRRTLSACFPRSGHRFLRNICQEYFGEAMKFRANHSGKGYSEDEANYIKDHDFKLLNMKKGIEFRFDTLYLVQYRHPLESLISYYEFQVKHAVVDDSRVSWNLFFPKHLEYWKKFICKWVFIAGKIEKLELKMVCYDDLYNETFDVVSSVIGVILGDCNVDTVRLSRIVSKYKTGFARYVEDQNNPENYTSKARNLFDFKFFDESLIAIENSLVAEYLDPLGISPKLN